jgi:hypothetical protein
LTSLILWPLVLLYGGALIPAPAGGGAMEFGFSAIMRDILPLDVMAAALIWWRFYSYYIYVLLGAFAAGRTTMRALSPTRAKSSVSRDRDRGQTPISVTALTRFKDK